MKIKYTKVYLAIAALVLQAIGVLEQKYD